MEGSARLAIDYGRMRLWGSLAFIGGSIGAGACCSTTVTPAGIIWLLVGACALLVFSVVVLPGRARRRKHAAAGRRRRSPDSARRTLRHAAIPAVRRGGGSRHVQPRGASTRSARSIGERLGFEGPTIGLLWATGVAAEVALFAFAARLVAPIPAPLAPARGCDGGLPPLDRHGNRSAARPAAAVADTPCPEFRRCPSRRHEVPAIGGAGAIREFRPGPLCRGGVGAVHGHRALRRGPALRGVRRASLSRHGAPVRGRRSLRLGSQSALAGRAAGRARSEARPNARRETCRGCLRGVDLGSRTARRWRNLWAFTVSTNRRRTTSLSSGAGPIA